MAGLVLNERKTRVTLATRLTGKGAAETAAVIIGIFKRPDPRIRQSSTFTTEGILPGTGGYVKH